MDKRLAGVFGGVSAVFFTAFGGAVIIAAWWWAAFFITVALVALAVAIRASLRGSVHDFHAALGELAPHLDAIDADWRRRARAAGWPLNVHDQYPGGLAAWCKAHGNGLAQPQRDVLEIARSLYSKDNVFREDHHQKSRPKMREMADGWGRIGAADRLCRPLLQKRVNREGVIMLAYLEAALAERNAEKGMSAGMVSEWARLGEQWPSLRQPEDIGPLPPPPLNVVSGYLKGETAELGDAVVQAAFFGAWGKYFSTWQLPNLDDAALMEDMTQKVTDAAMQGEIVVRCRRELGDSYRDVPRLKWRLMRLAAERAKGNMWRVSVVARPDQDVKALSEFLDCRSWIVDALSFQKKWPTRDHRCDSLRRSRLGDFAESGIDPQILRRLAD